MPKVMTPIYLLSPPLKLTGQIRTLVSKPHGISTPKTTHGRALASKCLSLFTPSSAQSGLFL